MSYKTKFKGPSIPKQRGIIGMARHQLGMDDDIYYGILVDEFGVKSSTALSFDQANKMIDIMIEKGFVLKPKKKGWRSTAPAPGQKRKTSGGKKVTALASPAERSKIAAVAALIEWRVDNGLELFLEKRVKIKNGKVRTAAEAWLAIEALKKMFENGMKAKHGPEWWLMQFEDERVMGYIEIHKPEEYQ